MRYWNKQRLDDRSIDEMLGICKGLIADNKVNHQEAIFLQDWMQANMPCCQDQMVNKIYRRIHEMLIDNDFDQDEHKELLDLLKMFTGQSNPGEFAANMTSTLPLDDPAPPVEFEGKTFCLTGKFVYGPRRVCEEVVKERGGFTRNKVTQKTDYLVTGFLGTTAWIHTSYGRKIEHAMKQREDMLRPFIITEDHWAEYAFRR